MIPVSPANGEALSGLVPMVVVAGILITLALNPHVRAGLAKLVHQFRANPVRTYLYGPVPAQPGAEEEQVAPEIDAGAVPAEDDFDYSIFSSQGPDPDDHA